VICHVKKSAHAVLNTPELRPRQRAVHVKGATSEILTIRMPWPLARLRKPKGDAILQMLSSQQEDRSLSYIEPSAIAARPASLAQKPISSDAILELVLTSLDDDKAEEIVAIDLRGKTAMADHMVICSGRSTRQVAAIAQKLLDRLKETFRLSARSEGKDVGDWVLIDTGDVVVHVFRPEVREFYQLEKMWQDTGNKPAA
jgi:ribosome-associated protein